MAEILNPLQHNTEEQAKAAAQKIISSQSKQTEERRFEFEKYTTEELICPSRSPPFPSGI